MTTYWKSHAKTHTGHVRSINEDAVLERPADGLWAVADGMGGHAAGDIASQMVVEALSQVNLTGTLADRVAAVELALMQVHTKIQDYALHHLSGQTMGSTVVVLLIKEESGVCLWAGDSRCYRYRPRQLEQLTKDHTQLAQLLEQGWSLESLGDYPSHVITRAIGASEAIEIDLTLLSIQPGDYFLLCSDGLTDGLSDEEIAYLFESEVYATLGHALKTPDGLQQSSANRIGEQLLQAALCGEARDNVSLITVSPNDGAQRQSSGGLTATHAYPDQVF